MPKKRLTDEQIAFALSQVEAGTSVGEIYREMGVSEATFYRWKKALPGRAFQRSVAWSNLKARTRS